MAPAGKPLSDPSDADSPALRSISAEIRAADPSRPPPDPRPIVISGPSGVGKGTLYKKLFEAHPGVFALAVSHTTRNPRPGEQHGKDYYFVSHDEFEALVKADGFVEHAKFGGNRYGTSKATIEEQSKKGQHVVLDIEMEVRCPFPSRVSTILCCWHLPWC